MAGEEDRPSDTPTAVEPGRGGEAAVALSAADLGAADLGAADLGAAERPAGGDEAVPRREEPAYRVDPPRSAMPTVIGIVAVVALGLALYTLYALYNPPENPAIGALRTDIDALKQQVAAIPKVDLGPLDGRVTALAADVAALKTAAAANAASKDAVAAIDGRIADLDRRVDAVKGAVAAIPKVDLGPLEGQVADLGKRVDPLDGRIAALDKRFPPLEAYFNAPKTGAAATEARQNGSAAETRAAPVAVIAQGIGQAIPAGRPFETEAKALGTLGVEPALLQPLDAVAAAGAATDAALASEFDGLQDAIVVAAAPVKTGTMLDRMMANAQSLVAVTKTGASSGGEADAVVSRITAALKRGALPAAAAEWDHLPDASKAKSTEWMERLKARIAAEEAAHAIAAKAVAALAVAQP